VVQKNLFSRKSKTIERADETFLKAKEAFINNNLQLSFELFSSSMELFNKVKEERRKESQICKGYMLTLDGFRLKSDLKFIDSMKAFGQAFVLFSSENEKDLATIVRGEQAKAQIEFAKIKGQEGDFEEAARLFDSAGAVFEMAGLSKEAAGARARSYVQRAAQVDDDFQKANFLKQAVEQFKKARENQAIVEAHALFYEGRALQAVNVRDALECLIRASDKYDQAGAKDRVKRVQQIIQELSEKVKSRPSDYGVNFKY
jgi:tetratricopeptide (TPR) repeat protein